MSTTTLTKLIKTLRLDVPKESSEFQEVFDNHIALFKGWLEREEAYFLHELAKLIEPNTTIVEIGSYEGKSTVALTSGSREDVITYAVDPHTGDITESEAGIEVNTYDNFKSNIASAGLARKIITKKTLSVLAAQEYNGAPIGLLFIDGWHSKEAVIEDIDSWSPYLHSNAIVVFDDWANQEVHEGILARRDKLPKLIGAVGKDLAFTNSAEIQESGIAKYAEKMYKRLKVLNILRRIKTFV